MKVLSKKVIEIVNDYADNLENIPIDDRDFLIAQINGLYEGFLASVFVDYMWIEKKPIGNYTKDGQYCLSKEIPGLFAAGIYCLPIEGGKYLAIDYER